MGVGGEGRAQGPREDNQSLARDFLHAQPWAESQMCTFPLPTAFFYSKQDELKLCV